MKKFYKLKKIENNRHLITVKKRFLFDITLDSNDLKSSIMFSFSMITNGQHRSKRSGGEAKRSSNEIFINTLEGKIAEYGFYRYLQNYGISLSEPDLFISGLGDWDSSDFTYKNKHIAIKSTAHYGQLLLLEKRDWDSNGLYVPNLNTDKVSLYDYIVLCRVKPVVADIIKKAKTKSEISQERFEVEITGYITNADLKYLISNNYLLPRKHFLNLTQMDADNYYVQANDLRDKKELIKELLNLK